MIVKFCHSLTFYLKSFEPGLRVKIKSKNFLDLVADINVPIGDDAHDAAINAFVEAVAA